MTDEDLKQIRTVLKEEIDSSLEPIKETLEEHTKKLDGITDQLTEVSEDVEEIKDKLDSHGTRITKIESHVGLSTPTE